MTEDYRRRHLLRNERHRFFEQAKGAAVGGRGAGCWAQMPALHVELMHKIGYLALPQNQEELISLVLNWKTIHALSPAPD